MQGWNILAVKGFHPFLVLCFSGCSPSRGTAAGPEWNVQWPPQVQFYRSRSTSCYPFIFCDGVGVRELGLAVVAIRELHCENRVTVVARVGRIPDRYAGCLAKSSTCPPPGRRPRDGRCVPAKSSLRFHTLINANYHSTQQIGKINRRWEYCD